MKLLLTILFLTSYILCTASIITVGKQKQYTSITAAVTVAKPYDTVVVEAGIYYEKNLIIKNPIFLKGINHPVLDGEHPSAPAHHGRRHLAHGCPAPRVLPP